jgi:hypothetical protein
MVFLKENVVTMQSHASEDSDEHLVDNVGVMSPENLSLRRSKRHPRIFI